MFSNIFKRSNRKYIIGGFALSGAIYFGYKNFNLYFDEKAKHEEVSQQYKLNNSDLLSENLRKFDTNYDKKDLSLRNGDLMFIKYNLGKLNMYNRYKMSMIRNLSKDRIYDDLGIVYKSGEMYYIILIPSVKLRSKSSVRELNISNQRSRGVAAVEYDDLIKENRPDIISLRRLICSDSTRDKLVKSLKSSIFDLKSSVNYGITSVISSWIHGLPRLGYNKSQFINALTYRDELDYTRASIKYNTEDELKNRTESTNSKTDKLMNEHSEDKSLGNKSKDHKSSANESIVDMSTDGESTLDKSEKNTKYMAENIKDIENTLREYEKEFNKYNLIIENFNEKLQKSKHTNESKYVATETSLVTRVYSKSGLLPLINNDRLFSIYNYFELDSLYRDVTSEEPETYSRLSSPFNIYTGGVNRVRLKNLKYPQVRDLLYPKK